MRPCPRARFQQHFVVAGLALAYCRVAGWLPSIQCDNVVGYWPRAMGTCRCCRVPTVGRQAGIAPPRVVPNQARASPAIRAPSAWRRVGVAIWFVWARVCWFLRRLGLVCSWRRCAHLPSELLPRCCRGGGAFTHGLPPYSAPSNLAINGLVFVHVLAWCSGGCGRQASIIYTLGCPNAGQIGGCFFARAFWGYHLRNL